MLSPEVRLYTAGGLRGIGASTVFWPLLWRRGVSGAHGSQHLFQSRLRAVGPINTRGLLDIFPACNFLQVQILYGK